MYQAVPQAASTRPPLINPRVIKFIFAEFLLGCA